MENEILNKRLIGTLTVRSVVTFVVSILALAAISWIYFYPSDVNGSVLRQNDVLQGAANGQEAKIYNESHNGEPTWWTNSLFGGMPTFQIAPSYKSNSIINTLGKVLTLGFPSPVSWVFLLMLGFFILMLSFDMKWYLAVLGAIGYAFSSYFFIIIDAGHIWKLLTLCYIPPTIAGIVWAYRGKYLLGMAVAAFFATLQLISNHVQMTYYSLFIIVPLVIAFLVIAIKDKKIGQWCIATCSLAVAAALALGANASNLYLSYKYSQETMRGGHSELTSKPSEADKAAVSSEPTNGGLSKEYITQWSYGIDETWTLMVPNVKGGSSMKTLAEVDDADAIAADSELGTEVLGQLPQYFGDQPFTSGPVYVGALIFVLFILGLFVVKGPVKWALLVATVLSVMLSWGHNFMGLTDFFIDHFPMYNKFRTVSSILVIAEFTMPLLAVLALKEMFTQDDFFKKYDKLTYGVFGACALLCALFALAPSLFGGGFTANETEGLNQLLGQQNKSLGDLPFFTAAVVDIRQSLVTADAWRSLFIIVLGFGVIMLYKFGKFNAVAAGLIIAAIVFVDMFAVNKRYLNEDRFVSSDEVPATTFEKTAADAKVLTDKDKNYRVLDIPNLQQPRSSYFHKTVGGYHAAKLTRYNDLLDRQIMPSVSRLINDINTKHTIDTVPPVLNMLNSKYFLLGDTENDVFRNEQALGNAWFVDTITYVNNADAEMKFLDNFDPSTSAVADAQFKDVLGTAKPKQAGDTIYETGYEPNKLTYKYRSAQGGLAVLSEVYFPWGWKATVDGKEVKIGRVNYVLRAMQLPAGDHTIVMTYDPQEVKDTESVASISVYAILFLILAALGWGIYNSTRRKDDELEKNNKEYSNKAEN